MARRTLQIPLGVGTTLDGGPYDNAEIIEVLDDDILHIEADDDDGVPLAAREYYGTHPETVRCMLTYEIKCDEPVWISAEPGGPIAEIPIADWMVVDVPGAGRAVWCGDEIDESQLAEIQSLVDEYGIEIREN